MIHTTVRPFPQSTGKLDLISVKHQFTITHNKVAEVARVTRFAAEAKTLSLGNEVRQLSWDLSLCRQPPLIIQDQNFHIVRAPQWLCPTTAIFFSIVHITFYRVTWVWTWSLKREKGHHKIALGKSWQLQATWEAQSWCLPGAPHKNDTCISWRYPSR